MQPREETKLATPRTSHLPFTLQLSGLPESPCEQSEFGLALERNAKESSCRMCRILSSRLQNWASFVRQPAWTHFAAGNHPIAPCADHAGFHCATPPGRFGAGGVIHHKEPALLQDIRGRAVGWKGGKARCSWNRKPRECVNISVLAEHLPCLND